MAKGKTDKSIFKYVPVYPQAPIDKKFHYVEDGVLKVNSKMFELVTDPARLKEIFDGWKGKQIAVDTETTGLTFFKDFIVGFSVAVDKDYAIYVPIRHQIRRTDKVKEFLVDKETGEVLLTKLGRKRTHTVEYYTDFDNPSNMDPKIALDMLYDLMKSSPMVIFFNAEFDLTMLKNEGYDAIKDKVRTFDASILTYLYDAENRNWNNLKACSQIVLGRKPTKFLEALGGEANFRYVDLAVGYPYAAADAANTIGIYDVLSPKVRVLLNKYKAITIDGCDKPYDVYHRDNELIRAFTDYYHHVNLLINTKAAKEYKEKAEKDLAAIEKKIYGYFNMGNFNLNTGSKEFKTAMVKKHIDTGLLTETGNISYGKKGIEEMSRKLRTFKDILRIFKDIDYKDYKLNKRASANELKLAEIMVRYGKHQFKFIESVNYLQHVKTIEGIPLDKHGLFDELKLLYRSEEEKLNILKAIQKRSSLTKALNSYIDKLCSNETCHMHYNLKGTASGRLSSGNGSKNDKKKNHYFIDLNAQNLTKPHSAFYRAYRSDEDENILGWKFDMVTEEYMHANKDKEIIVEGSDPASNIRNCIVAPKGRYIASLDYSAQEYRVLAILSKDHKMIENFKNGIDPHTATAWAIWGEEHYDRQKRKKAKGCVGDGTLISTTRGQVAVDKLLPTDKLIGVDGKPQSYAMTDYIGVLIDIEWSNGLKSSFTPNHPVQVWDGTKIRWKAVSCLTKEDEVISYVGNYNQKHEDDIRDFSDKVILRNNKSVVKKFNTNTHEFAYLAGLYLGDGTINLKENGSCHEVRLCADNNILDYVMNCALKIGLNVSSVRPVGINKRTNELRICNKAYAELMNSLFGRTKSKCCDKGLLSIWGKSELQHFLAGLVDSDGTTAFSGYVVISNTVDEVIHAVVRAANAVGIKCHVDKKTATLNGKRYNYKDVTLYDLGENILPIQNKNRVPSNKGKSRRGTWSVSSEYRELLRKTICNGVSNSSLHDLRVCVRNIADGYSKLNKNNLDMLEKYGFEQPIKANMQCVKPLSFTKKTGHVNVIETENHTYIADGVGSHNCNFLMNYCGGPRTLAENLDIPFEEAVDIINKYEKAYSECIAWKKHEQKIAGEKQDWVAVTPFGRPRQFKSVILSSHNIKNGAYEFAGIPAEERVYKSNAMIKAVERKIISHLIQGTCGDICRWDLIRLYRRFFKNRDEHIDFYSTVHDEINFAIDKEYVIDYVREIDDIMTIRNLSKELPIVTSIDLGYTLGVLFPFEWEDETRTNLIPMRV